MQQNNIDISENLREIKNRIADCCEKYGRKSSDVNLMAVTKTVPPEDVNLAVSQGIVLLGENRVQELIGKYDNYILKRNNIHFIGHLQTNKVKYIIDRVSLIESVDSVKLAVEISNRALQLGRVMPILIQVNISEEASKSGFLVSELEQAVKIVSNLEGVCVNGFMCIPAKDDITAFQRMDYLYNEYKAKQDMNISMKYLSMGMSGDYEKAIAHGSNIIRLGSAIFGKRK